MLTKAAVVGDTTARAITYRFWQPEINDEGSAGRTAYLGKLHLPSKRHLLP